MQGQGQRPGMPDAAALMQAIGRLQSETMVLRRRLARMEAYEQLREAGREPSLPVDLRSQTGEDIVLWDLFRGQHDGFFIEAGAYDGTTLSVSYLFEAIGWKGLLVEAIPEACSKCVASRPGSRVVNAALSKRGSSGEAAFTVVEGSEWKQLFSYLHATPEHAARTQGCNRRSVRVPLTTLSALLETHTGPIDFLVLDVEGTEADVLDGLDLNRHRPRVMMIEDNTIGNNPALDRAVGAGYTMAGLAGPNRVYIRSDEPALLGRLGIGPGVQAPPPPAARPEPPVVHVPRITPSSLPKR